MQGLLKGDWVSVAGLVVVLALAVGCGDDGGSPGTGGDDAGGGGGTGITASPSEISFDHEVGVDECPRMVGTFTLTNGTESTVDYSLQSSPDSITAAPAGGNLPAGVSTDISVSYFCSVTESFEGDLVYSIPRGEGTVTVHVRANVTGG